MKKFTIDSSNYVVIRILVQVFTFMGLIVARLVLGDVVTLALSITALTLICLLVSAIIPNIFLEKLALLTYDSTDFKCIWVPHAFAAMLWFMVTAVAKNNVMYTGVLAVYFLILTTALEILIMNLCMHRLSQRAIKNTPYSLSKRLLYMQFLILQTKTFYSKSSSELLDDLESLQVLIDSGFAFNPASEEVIQDIHKQLVVLYMNQAADDSDESEKLITGIFDELAQRSRAVLDQETLRYNEVLSSRIHEAMKAL